MEVLNIEVSFIWRSFIWRFHCIILIINSNISDLLSLSLGSLCLLVFSRGGGGAMF